MKHYITLSFAATVIALSTPFSSHAQSFEQYLDNAKTAFAAKDYELVKLELQDAMKLVNEQTSNVLGSTFPPAPDGWQASDLKTESNPMAGTQLTKTYQKDKSKVTATVTHGSPLIASYATVFANPMLMQGEKIRLGRDHAMLQMNDDGKSGELTYLVKGKYLIQLNGRQLSDKAELVNLLKSWDINTLKAQVVE